jgi:alkaline phosphatase
VLRRVIGAPCHSPGGNLPAMINANVHSGEDVILTAAGPGSERVRGQMNNTEVFRVMVEALGLGQGD